MSHDDLPGMEPRAPDQWKLKREISTGDVLIALSMLLGLFLWGTGIENRLAVVEKSQEMQARVDSAQDSVVRDSVGRIEQAVRDIQQFQLRQVPAK